MFLIKYLHKLGFKDINNELFTTHSWYFRNALVRANYKNLKKGVYATNQFVVHFLENLLLGENNELKNRYLRIDGKNDSKTQSAIITQNNVSKSNICTLNCTLEEHMILEFIKDNPRATQKEIAAHIHKSERTVKTMTANLQNKDLLERVNGKRNGFWKTREIKS